MARRFPPSGDRWIWVLWWFPDRPVRRWPRLTSRRSMAWPPSRHSLLAAPRAHVRLGSSQLSTAGTTSRHPRHSACKRTAVWNVTRRRSPNPSSVNANALFTASDPAGATSQDSGYAAGVRGPNKVGDCVPVNWTWTNNIRGTSQTFDQLNRTVPEGGVSFVGSLLPAEGHIPIHRDVEIRMGQFDNWTSGGDNSTLH